MFHLVLADSLSVSRQLLLALLLTDGGVTVTVTVTVTLLLALLLLLDSSIQLQFDHNIITWYYSD